MYHSLIIKKKCIIIVIIITIVVVIIVHWEKQYKPEDRNNIWQFAESFLSVYVM